MIASRLMQLAPTAAKQVLGQPPVCDGTAGADPTADPTGTNVQRQAAAAGAPGRLPARRAAAGVTLSLHGWRLLADGELHPGGCKVSAEEGDLDASPATRWHELCARRHREKSDDRASRPLAELSGYAGKRIARAPTVRRYGRLTRATGLVLEATGLQLPLGATCSSNGTTPVRCRKWKAKWSASTASGYS